MKQSYLFLALALTGCPDAPPAQSPAGAAPTEPSEPIDSPPTEPGAADAGAPLPKEDDSSGSTSPMPDR